MESVKPDRAKSVYTLDQLSFRFGNIRQIIRKERKSLLNKQHNVIEINKM
jgi:hypothetical protein